jgi:sulfonate transport system ATP-binding protein
MATDLQRLVEHAGSTSTGTPPGDTAVDVRHLTKRFGDRVVLDDLDLTIGAGEFVALVGPSGCGKSTLLRILAGLDPDISGEVRVPARRSVVFQQPKLMPWKKVWRNVLLGLPGRPQRARAEAALDEVGLPHAADAWPKTLSGGEAQRVALARALVREPKLLLLDEPFASLDALTRQTAQILVSALWQRHDPAVLLVTHDVEEALLLADRVILMRHGTIGEDIRVDLPRPRNVSDPELVSRRAEIRGWLGVEA